MSDRDGWRADLVASTELDRYLAVEDPRRALGICGDAEDNL